MTRKKFTLYMIGYVGATPDPSFTFNAENIEDAVSKGKGWCRYHSKVYEEDYFVAPTVANSREDGWETSNEYVN